MDLASLKYLSQQADTFLWPEEDLKQRRKRERILQCASDLFVRHGYRKTSVDEIARAAGVAKGTIYLYYQNKAELVCHAVTMEEQVYITKLVPAFEAAATPKERFASLIRHIIIMTREMPLTTSLIQGDHEITLALSELDDEVLQQMQGLQVDTTISLLDAATGNKMSKSKLQMRGQLLIDLLLTMTTSNLTNQANLPWEDYANELTEVIMEGFLA